METGLLELARLIPPTLSSALSLLVIFYVWQVDRRLLSVQTDLKWMKETIEDVRFNQPNPVPRRSSHGHE